MVSIIIPVYNTEKYVVDCLRSIRNQTFTDFEAILVNDGSTDRSEEICRRFCAQDSRFRLISIPNRGAAGARNVGLQEAKGDYIAFTDSDDWLEPDYLEYLWNGMQKTGADIFYCDFITDGVIKHAWTDAVFAGGEAVCELVTGGCVNRIHNKLYKRNCIDGILFPEGRDLCEDAAWTPKILERAQTVGRGFAGKYHYRTVSDSLVHRKLHTESQVCALYRNWLDRCIVLTRNYGSWPKYQCAIFEECEQKLRKILSSGYNNLDKWDAFQTAQKLVFQNRIVFQQNGSAIVKYFLNADTYSKCYWMYLKDNLRSSDTPFLFKGYLVKALILSFLRKLR